MSEVPEQVPVLWGRRTRYVVPGVGALKCDPGTLTGTDGLLLQQQVATVCLYGDGSEFLGRWMDVPLVEQEGED